MNISRLNDRLDAIEDLQKYNSQLSCLRVKLSRLPDMERLQSKVFAYSVRNSVRAVFFENVSFQKLRELKSLLKHFRDFSEIIEPLRVESESFKSERLRQLVRYKEEGGLLPYLEEAIQEFEYLVVWKKAAGGDEDIPEPKQGLDENFDRANDLVNACKFKLDAYL